MTKGAKKTLILDLDETLIHTKAAPFDGQTAIATVILNGAKTSAYISERPGLQAFLATMSQYYTIVLYTAGTEQYAHAALKATKTVKYFSAVYHREHCKKNFEGKFVKNIAVTRKDMKDIVLIDDSEVHFDLQSENMLLIKPYKGEASDNELLKLTAFLKELSQKEDVRCVMERFYCYKVQKEFESSQNEKSMALKRDMGIKFMKDLKMPLNKNSFLQDESECDFDPEDDIIQMSVAQLLPQVTFNTKSLFQTQKTRDAKLSKDSVDRASSSIFDGETDTDTPRTVC